MIIIKKLAKLLILLFFLWVAITNSYGQGLQTEGNISFVLDGKVNIVVKGNLSFDPVQVTFQDNSESKIHITGELITNGSDFKMNGGLVYDGNSRQVLSGNLILSELIVENTSGVELQGLIEVLNYLNLSNGFIISEQNELLIGETTNINVRNENCFVIGPLNIKTNASVGAKSIFFPIGISQTYRPVTLNFYQTQSQNQTYTAQVFTNSFPNRILESDIKSVSQIVYWNLESTETNMQEGAIDLHVTETDLVRMDSAAIVKDDGTYWINIGGKGLTNIPGEITSTKKFTNLGYFALANANPPPPYTQFIPGEYNTIAPEQATIEFDSIELINTTTVKYRYKSFSSGGSYFELTPNQDGNLFAADLNENMFNGLGMKSYFVFEMTAGAGWNTNTETTYLRYGGEGEDFRGQSLGFGDQQTDYRIIAVPLDLNSKSVSSVFVDDLGGMDNTKWRLWHYRDDNTKDVELKASDILERGKGYWLLIKDNAEIDTGEGTTWLNNEEAFYITLHEGWNQIGNPYNFRLSWQNVIDINCKDLELVGYRNGQINGMDFLEAFEGGFVQVSSGSGTIQLEIPYEDNVTSTCVVAEGPKKDYPIDEDNWLVNLHLSSGEMGNGLGGFGMHTDASLERDEYDKSAFPRFIHLLEILFAHENDQITRDIVPTSDSHVWEFEVNTDVKSQNTILEWNNTHFGNNDKVLYLFDETNQKIINMREQNSYKYSTVSSSSFQIHYGYEEDIAANLFPSRISLGPGYPNPATSRVTIPFTLPESDGKYNVSLIIYDLLGNEIKTLLTKQLGSGFHEVIWNLNDNQGRDTSSGVYIAHLLVVVNGDKDNLNNRIIIR